MTTPKPTKPSKERVRVIRCSRCDIPNPYGSAHICDEYDYAVHQLKANPKIEDWLKKGLKDVQA